MGASLYIYVMKILAYAPNYIPHYNSGDTTTLHFILRLFPEAERTVMLNRKIEEYEIDGIKVISRCSGAFKDADLIFCQLDTTRETITIAPNKPIIWLMHNTFPYGSVLANIKVGVVYNAEWAVKERNFPHNPSFVLPPLVFPEDYKVQRGEKVTIVNLNKNKIGNFWQIAKSMPDVEFLAVKGAYSEQIVQYLPNVEVLEHQSNIREVFKQCKILLMPSAYESWGRVATEAICSGIPVIAHPTPGLLENLGESGIFVDRNNTEGWVKEIRTLQGKKEYDLASMKAEKRSIELHPDKKVKEFKEWVKDFVYNHKNRKNVQ